MKFSAIPGLEQTKKNLISSVKENHIAHAQLFLSKKGGCNLPMAMAYATYLNCENPTDNDSCGECPSCTKTNKLIHPDVHFVFPVCATEEIKGKDVVSNSYITQWRSFLLDNPFGALDDWIHSFGGEFKQVNISKEESYQITKNLSLMAFEAQYKVMIIWLPEYLHNYAANGLLKILEEPPNKTVFLLVSNDSEQLLTTILSRTQIVKIPQLKIHEMSELLFNRFDQEQARANQVANLADGNITQALYLLNSEEDPGQKLFQHWMRLCYLRDFTGMVKMADEYHQMSKIDQKGLLEYASFTIRESLISNMAGEKLMKVIGEEKEFVENFAKNIDLDKVSFISEKINDAYYHIERNASPKITFLDLSLRIARRIR